MYAVIETGGAQHKVQPGDELTVEKLPVDPGAGRPTRPRQGAPAAHPR